MNLKEQMNNHPTISLKKLADATGCCYQYLLKASKKPIQGEAYDAAAINYDEVERLVRRKKAIEDIDFDAIEATVKVIEPVSKLADISVDTRFKLRADENIYTAIYLTDTHIVFIADNSTQPRVMNLDTFAHQSPRIVE